MDSKIDFRDVTFAIPLRLDSPDRKTNIVTVINYLLSHFQTRILIGEEGQSPQFPSLFQQHWRESVRWISLQTNSQFFHKTRILNALYREAQTPILVSYDSDVLFHVRQYVEAAEKIRHHLLDFCYPFNQPTFDIPKRLQPRFIRTNSVDSVEKDLTFNNPMPPPGGCLFMNRQCLEEIGMENEAFISYGPEDMERRDRIRILGYRLGSIDGKLFHLEHDRTVHSTVHHDLFEKNEAEHRKILQMDRETLRDYVATWQHVETI